MKALRRRLGAEGEPTPGPPADPGSSEPPEAVFFEVAARFLDVQVSTDDVLDTKATSTFTVGSTVLPLTFGLLSLSGKAIPTAAVYPFILALVAYVVLLVFAWRASVIRAIEYRPHIPTLEKHSLNYRGSVLHRWAAEEYARSIAINRPALQRKARYVGVAWTALFVEGLLLSGAALFTLL